MNVIFGNFGNQTIALMQWAFEQQLKDIFVVTVDTGFAAACWQERVNKAQLYAQKLGFEVIRLKSKPRFQDLMIDRKGFPTTKFQWCAGFLKGLCFIDWLDEHDPSCEATILMGKRRQDSRANRKLNEFIESSEHFGDRRVWFPLFKTHDDTFRELISKAGFTILEHRSLECDPCVNSKDDDFQRISAETIQKTKALECKVGKTMFHMGIEEMIEAAKNPHKKVVRTTKDRFNMGCGSPYGCGE